MRDERNQRVSFAAALGSLGFRTIGRFRGPNRVGSEHIINPRIMVSWSSTAFEGKTVPNPVRSGPAKLRFEVGLT